ncbi:MAG: GAF domain-containing protein [Bacillota bacterium]
MNLEMKELQLLHLLNKTVGSSLEINKILQQIVEIVRDITGGDSCFIYLLDQKRKRLVLKASWKKHSRILDQISVKLGEGITGWVAQAKTPVSIAYKAYNDSRFKYFPRLPEDKFEAFLSVPVISNDKLIGVINVQHAKPHEYTETEIALAATAAQYAGVSIINARLYEEARKKNSQLEALFQISQSLVSNKYFEEILTFIATTTAEIVKVSVCSIMLINGDKKSFRFKAISCPDQVYHRDISIPIQSTVCGQTYRTSRPVYVADVRRESKFALPDFAKKYNLCSMLSVPMMCKNEMMGVVNVYTVKPHEFSEEEISLLQAVANHAAAAIHHTRLAQEIDKTKNDLMTHKKLQRAKSILINNYKISEEEAHRLILKKSMDLGRPLLEIAEAIITGAIVRPGMNDLTGDAE